MVASGPFTCCRSGGGRAKLLLPLISKCPQSPAQIKQDCTTSMQEHQSRKRIKLGTDPIGLKRLRSVILVAHSPRTKNTRTCAASLYRCCDRAEEPEHHPLVRIFNGSGITRAPRKELFHVINGVLKTTYNSDPTAKSKLGEFFTSTPPAVTLRIRNSPPRKSTLLLARAIRA